MIRDQKITREILHLRAISKDLPPSDRERAERALSILEGRESEFFPLQIEEIPRFLEAVCDWARKAAELVERELNSQLKFVESDGEFKLLKREEYEELESLYIKLNNLMTAIEANEVYLPDSGTLKPAPAVVEKLLLQAARDLIKQTKSDKI